MVKSRSAPFDRRAIPPAASESYWTAADGHKIRHIEWPAPDTAGPEKQLSQGVNSPKSRGSILFMAGRGDAYEKYLETFEHWREQGWQVTAADWRGQAGSGRLGDDLFTGHIGDFAEWITDLAGFWADWAKDRSGELVLVGHSMGGHLVARAAAEHVLDPVPDGLLLSTPMLGVHPQYVPLIIQQAIANVMCMIGDPRRLAWKWSEKPGELPRFRQALLTHDDERYADELFWRDTRSELVMGPGSWGWVKASMTSTRLLERRGMLEAIDCPVFLLSAQDDKLVSPRANHRAAQRIPNMDFFELGPESSHEILREIDPIRDRAIAAIDAFLDRLSA